MRRSAFVCLLCVTGMFGAPSAWARGGATRAALTQHLLEKGFALLREAERAKNREDTGQAQSLGRQAERVFLDVLAQDPRESRAALLGGQAATFAGDLRSAGRWVDRLKRISALGDDDPDVHYLRAFIFTLGAERPDRGLGELRRMYAINPRARRTERDNLWYIALLAHGRRLLRADQAEDALAHFRTGARIARRLGDPNKEMTMVGNVGVALQRAERYAEASKLWADLIKKQPENPVWHWQAGLVLASQNRFAEAVTPYREVIRLRKAGRSVPPMNEEMSYVHLRLGNCLRQLSERQRDPKQRQSMIEEAERLIRHFRDIKPDEALGHKWLGVLLYQHYERPYEALPHFHKAFELDPICVDSLKFMLQIHQSYPPPPDQMPKDDAAAAAAALEAWAAPIKDWEKDLAEGAERRQKELDRRVNETGLNGCT